MVQPNEAGMPTNRSSNRHWIFVWFAICLGSFWPSLSSLRADDPPVSENLLWLTYAGEGGPGKGKHLIFIAADQEYRSEHSLPMLAKMLSKHHGFDCTVLFAVNDKDEVDPTQKIRWEDKSVTHRIPGLEQLDNCDLLILFSRLITLEPNQFDVIYRYLDSGKPIIGIRTANHGFIGFDYKKGSKKIDFGEDVLGGRFETTMGAGSRIRHVESLWRKTKTIRYLSVFMTYGEHPMCTELLKKEVPCLRTALHSS